MGSLAGGNLMYISIREQILIPIIGIQAVAVTAIAVVAATLAADRREREIIGRVNGVIASLGHANFPHTASVLAKMRGLSGADFAFRTGDGRVAASTLPTLEALPPAVRAVRPIDRLDSLGDSPTLVHGGVRYFAVTLETSGSLRDSSLLVLYPETNWRQERWEAAAPPLALGLATLGLMAAVTGWIAQRLSIRIRGVQRQVARIAAGDFEGFEPGRRGDEVQELAGSINGMCDQLRRMQLTIRQSERTRLLAQLAAGLAHQIRNSLTGARMSVQLHARRFPPPAGDETLNVALRQLAMTEEQVKGILSLGRSERRAHAPCELGRLLGEIAMLVEPSCQHAGVSIRHPRPEITISIMADESGLRSAILNLTLNAIEAAGSGGEVRLGASTEEGGVVIEVCDTGPGPPPDVAESLFEAFVTGKAEGVGLGLAIAQRVAVEHGGRLSWCRQGGETRFRLSLPGEVGAPEGAAWPES